MASKVANVIRGSKAGQFTPHLFIVDDDIDPGNIYQVMHALATKCHPTRGIQQHSAAVGHNLWPFLNLHDRRYGIGAAITYDCTWPTDWDPEIEVPKRSSFDNIYPKEIQEHVLKNWSNYGFKAGIPESK